MSDRPDRERLRPTVEGRARLLAAIEAAGPPHVVDAGTLGEYADVLANESQMRADAAFPEVAAHLERGCPSCTDDLRELVPDLTPQPPPPQAGEGEQVHSVSPLPRKGAGLGVGAPLDSGIHAVDLPDPRAEEETVRRQRLRRLRDGFLVVAAVAILLMGLSLIGLAYLSSGQPGAQIGLTPVPATAPAPATGSGRAAPTGMICPGSHPIKGNRTSMIYHLPGGEFYDATGPEECFASPADAEAAGYRRSQR